MPAPSIVYLPFTKRAESGAAIILAILVLALIAAVASSILRDYGAAVASVSGRHDQAQARVLARGAIDWARNILAEDARTSAIDYTGEHWAIHVPPTPVEEGEVGGELEDVSGRFDLNSVVKMGMVDQSQVITYGRLLSELGISPHDASVLTASLVDWIDADNVAIPSGEAESDWYSALTPPLSPANAPLTDIDELSLVRGYSTALINRLRPFVAALPAPAPLNVNTASAEVLAAMVSGLGVDDARILVAKRQLLPFKDLGDFKTRLPQPDIILDATRLSVASRYFMASGQAHYGQATTRMQVLLDRKNIWPEIIWQKIL